MGRLYSTKNKPPTESERFLFFGGVGPMPAAGGAANPRVSPSAARVNIPSDDGVFV